MGNINYLNKAIELSENKIQVFLFNLDDYDVQQFHHFLSADERERSAKLKVEVKKKQFMLSRSLLRKILSNITEKNHNEIKFYYGNHNKPYIKEKHNNKMIEFNISHSDQYILIGLSLHNKVGVDIEKVNKEIDFESLSKRFFSKKEKEYIKGIDPENKPDAFFTIWTRKEAFIKATGKGIAYGLDTFSVITDEQLKSRIELEEKKSGDDDWFCFDLMSIENYKTAISTNNDAVELIFYP